MSAWLDLGQIAGFNIQGGSITLALRQNVPETCLGSCQQQMMKKANFSFKF